MWIDCLCIIQDNEDDWRRESARMAGVYAGAQMTIAAYNAKDATVGFSPTKASAKGATLFIPGDTDDPDIFVTALPGSGEYPMPAMFPYDTALATRAGAVQESILSPRTLGIGPDLCYFECNEVYCDDRLRQPLEILVSTRYSRYKARINLNTTPGDEATSLQAALGSWDSVLSRYSESCLTEGKDELPAVSAVASFLAEPIGGRYVAGLWLDDLSYGLAWHCEGVFPDDCKPSINPAE